MGLFSLFIHIHKFPRCSYLPIPALCSLLPHLHLQNSACLFHFTFLLPHLFLVLPAAAPNLCSLFSHDSLHDAFEQKPEHAAPSTGPNPSIVVSQKKTPSPDRACLRPFSSSFALFSLCLLALPQACQAHFCLWGLYTGGSLCWEVSSTVSFMAPLYLLPCLESKPTHVLQHPLALLLHFLPDVAHLLTPTSPIVLISVSSLWNIRLLSAGICLCGTLVSPVPSMSPAPSKGLVGGAWHISAMMASPDQQQFSTHLTLTSQPESPPNPCPKAITPAFSPALAILLPDHSMSAFSPYLELSSHVQPLRGFPRQPLPKIVLLTFRLLCYLLFGGW